MNCEIHFSTFVFLSLLSLLNDQLSRFSAPGSMLESGKAIDRTAAKPIFSGAFARRFPILSFFPPLGDGICLGTDFESLDLDGVLDDDSIVVFQGFHTGCQACV
jgi:hypothetical protein